MSPAAASSRCRCGSPSEEAPPLAELPEHDAEGVEVDAPVADLLPRHLRRHVPGLREDDAGDRVAAPVLPARRAEVDELHLADVADHHVLRAEVAVDDAERRAVDARRARGRARAPGPSRSRSRPPRASRPAPPSGWRAAARRRGERPSTYSTTRVRLAVLVGRSPRAPARRPGGSAATAPAPRRGSARGTTRRGCGRGAPSSRRTARSAPSMPGRGGEVHVPHPAPRQQLQENEPPHHPRERMRRRAFRHRGKARLADLAGRSRINDGNLAHAPTLRRRAYPGQVSAHRGAPACRHSAAQSRRQNVSWHAPSVSIAVRQVPVTLVV